MRDEHGPEKPKATGTGCAAPGGVWDRRGKQKGGGTRGEPGRSEGRVDWVLKLKMTISKKIKQ